ncbi:hypothetical protein B0H19DRAFT_1060113 [Mycena capillaripes]|nr:hypothetical protein B0H19DRAFT_1060113 [Mycena capillaripes]
MSLFFCCFCYLCLIFLAACIFSLLALNADRRSNLWIFCSLSVRSLVLNFSPKAYIIQSEGEIYEWWFYKEREMHPGEFWLRLDLTFDFGDSKAKTRPDAMVPWPFRPSGQKRGINWALGESSESGTYGPSLFEGEVIGEVSVRERRVPPNGSRR